MKHQLLLSALAVMSWPALSAQIVTTRPPILQTDSRGVVITYHADRGNGELASLGASAKVYAHTGVITSQSSSPADWKHAPVWGDNSVKYQMTYAGNATWTLDIGDIDTYYGLADGETVERLAFVFRNADGSLQGKTAEGGDIFVDVYPPGRRVTLASSSADNIVSPGESATVTFRSTEAASLVMTLAGVEVGSAANATELTVPLDFDSPGEFEVTATATFADGTPLQLSESIAITVLGASNQADYPGGIPMPGAVKNPQGGDEVIFCLPAPGKSSVVIVGAWDDYRVLPSRVMNYQDYDGQRYFWTPVSDLEPERDYPYYYIVDNTARVGDPYARLVLDPYNDRYIPSDVFPDMPAYPAQVSNVYLAVYNSEADEYDWQHDDGFTRPDADNLVIYELLIRDFTGTEGSARGNGTLAGVMERLDYLQQLGINAIELLPIMEFDGNNSWGYNTNFYFAPDKAYGTPDDYRALIDECHRRGIAVILDIVFNQTAGGHPWYQMYPIDRNPMYNGSAPHAYSVLNDWNQDHPLVLRQEQDALRYWLEAYHVDGFRFDLVKGLGANDSYNNTYNPVTNTYGTPSESATNAFNQSRIDRMALLHAAIREVSPTAFFINENLAGAAEENAMATDGDLNWANINDASCQFAMGWQSNSSLNRFWAPLDGNRTIGSTVSYAESHDEERMAYKQQQWGVESVKADKAIAMRRLGSVAAQMLMTPGAHMIWQFQEFGADQTTKNSSGNNTAPKKVVWSYLANPDNYSLLRSYKELINTRISNPELFNLRQAAVAVNLAGWDKGRTVVLTSGSSRLVLAVNPSVESAMTVNPGVAALDAMQVMSQSPGVEFALDANGGIRLEPGAYVVLGTSDLIGIDTPEAVDDVDSPAVYFNMQGQRVEHPRHGMLLICRRGASASKVVY